MSTTWKIILAVVAVYIGLSVFAVAMWASNSHGYSGPTITTK
ncbi:MAG: hypothetical protein ACXVRE_06265 [Gaiellaceae bacterium]